MSARASLELRAAAVNVIAGNFPNDSRLEQVVLAAEKALVASIAAVTIQPSVTTVSQANN